MILCGIKRVNVVTNHSVQLGIIVLGFSLFDWNYERIKCVLSHFTIRNCCLIFAFYLIL